MHPMLRTHQARNNNSHLFSGLATEKQNYSDRCLLQEYGMLIIINDSL